MKFKNLKTKNYLLHSFKISDVKTNYLIWLKDKQINKYLTNSNFKNIKELKKYVGDNFFKKNSLFLKISDKNYKHIGNLRIHDVNKTKSSAFLGIMIGDKNQWNKGAAQEVIHSISKYLFRKYKITKIFLGVDRENKRAINAYLKSGFVFNKRNSQTMVRDYFISKLCIGTAQFGSHYGIANKTGIVKMNDIKKIKNYTLSKGIRTIDTAVSYFDGEKRLAKVGIGEYTTISKLPVTEPGKNRKKWVIESIKKSLKILKLKSFYAVFVHNTNYLYDKKGHEIYKGLVEAQKKGLVKKIGASTYTIEEIKTIISKYKKMDIIMLPFNVFDQRPIKTKILEKLEKLNIEIYSRSVFLQGLLLMKHNKIPKPFIKWMKKFKNLDLLSRKLNLKKYEICLRYVLSNSFIDKVVVGSDNFNQLKQLVNTKGILKLDVKNLNASTEINLINPSKWQNIKRGIKE